MKHIKPLSCESIITLQEMYKYAPGHRLRQRAQIIFLSNKGLSINELSYITELDRDTISLTLDCWEKKGLRGLYDEHRSGRRPIYNKEEQALIASRIEQEPRQLKKVLADVEEETGKSASLKTLKRIAKRQGMVWKRLKKGLAGQPDGQEYNLKKQALEKLKKKHNLEK